MSDEISSKQLINVWQSLIIDEKLVVETTEILGCGAYGTVYGANYHRCPCVVKKMHSVLSKECYKQFYEEAKAMKCLSHPCILSFYGVIFKEDSPCLPILVMERLWKPLYVLITIYNWLHPYFRLSLLHDVICGLSYLHNESFLHRDLTPNNILVTKDGRAKISDFGQATKFHAQKQISTCPGTVVYMPPEGLKSNPNYSYKLDVFSFGCVFIFTMTGLVPVQNDDEYTTICDKKFRKVSEAELRKYSINKLKSSTQQIIVHACIEDDPTDRPNSTDLCLQVEKCMTDLDLSSEVKIVKMSMFEWLQLHSEHTEKILMLEKKIDHSEQHISDLTAQLKDEKILSAERGEENTKLKDESLKAANIYKEAIDELSRENQMLRVSMRNIGIYSFDVEFHLS